MKHRLEKVNSLIKEELSKIILREIEVPNALLTIGEVEITQNMSQAKVSISIFPDHKEKEAMRILQARANYLNHLLEDKVHLRPMPRIYFEIDRGPEKAARIEELLRKD